MADEQDDVKQGGSSKLIMIVVIAVLALGGGGAAWFFLLADAGNGNGNGEDVAEAAPRTQGPVHYSNLSPSFIVNFPHQGRQRFLQADLTVMARDEAALDAVQQHMPIIRHNLISLFNAQLLLVFEDPSGIEQLRRMATEEVRQVLRDEIGRPGIEEVLFTSFVMQ